MHKRIPAVVFAAALLLSLPGQALRAQSDADVIGAYRLTMPAMAKAAAVNAALAEELKKDPRMVERATLTAELEKLNGRDERTAAENERVEAIEARLTVLARETPSLKRGKSLKDAEANMQAYPPMAAALRTAGIEAREFAILTMATLQAGMVMAFMEHPNFDRSKVSDVQLANAKFMQEHEAEIKRLQRPSEQK